MAFLDHLKPKFSSLANHSGWHRAPLFSKSLNPPLDCNRWQLFWKKVFKKSRPNPWKKKLWRSYFFSKVAWKAPANYQQINSSAGIFQRRSYLLWFRIPRTSSFQNIFQLVLLKIACSLFQCSLINVCFEHLFWFYDEVIL